MGKEQLTEKEYWEDRWNKIRLPSIVEPTTKHPTNKEVIRIFQNFLPKKKLRAVEIGGAPGQFAAYLSKYHGYEASVIEYSETGCQKTRENFDLLGLNVEVYEQDFFGDISNLPRFDVVFAMGFIEHFKNLDEVFQRHVNLLRNDGILVLGVPNYRGITKKVLSRTAPEMLSRHNLEAMDLQNWQPLEDIYGLTHDTISLNFQTNYSDFYGKIIVNLTGVDVPTIIQVLDKQRRVVRQASTDGNGSLEFSYLTPETYTLKRIEDVNQNGRWDTGNYLKKIQPEKISYHKESISIRSNFHYEMNWDLTQ